MKATGEVMAIGSSFELALMKAVGSIELGLETLTLPELESLPDEEIVQRLHRCDSERSFTVYEALKRGVSLIRSMTSPKSITGSCPSSKNWPTRSWLKNGR